MNRAIRCAVAVVVFAVSVAGAAAEKKVLTHEDLWMMKRVGAPEVSPDGRFAVFSVTDPSYDDKEQVSDLWIVATDGRSAARRLTSTKGVESGVSWSDDGRRIAFTAKRESDEVSQVYVLDINGGEAVRITTLSTGASSPQFSPDGKLILFSSNVFPSAKDDEENKKFAKEKKERKINARVYEGFPIRRWDAWLEEKRPHLFVQSAEPGAKPRDLLAGSKLIGAAGFGGRPGEGSGETLDAVWTPDGKSIVFVATENRNTAAYDFPSSHLFVISAESGEPRALTSGKDSYSAPKFSPDRELLGASVNVRGPKLYTLDRIAAFAWPAMGERRIVTSSFDRSVGEYAFTPDSRTIYLTAEDAGLEKIYFVPVAGGDVKLAIEPEYGVYGALRIPENATPALLIAQWGSSVNPAEIVRIDSKAKKHTNLTNFNAEKVASIDWQKPEHFWFTASNGKRIHNMIVLPPAFDAAKKYPLLVLMHGGPHGQWRDQITLRWNFHLLASSGYVVLMTNYTGSTGFGEKFAQDIQGDPLATPGLEINEAADEAIRRFPYIDATRQAAAGASYGGHLAAWMQATTTRYDALVMHAGAVDMESQWGTSDTIYSREVSAGGPPWMKTDVWEKQNPLRFAANFKTPMMVSVGEKDYRVPLNQSIYMWSILQRQQVPSKLIVFPEENHWIMNGENGRFWYGEFHDWLARWVK